MGFRYVIVEVDSVIAPGDSATITEIELLDASGKKISYMPMEKAYEKSVPNYWNVSGRTQWGSLNLSNGDLKYANSDEGAWSSTVFMFMANVNFSRFALDLGSAKDIEIINVWAGNPQKRIPKNIKFYGVNEYTYETHLEGRSNAGLFSLCNFSFNGSELTVAKYTATTKKEKYFEMNALTSGIWSSSMHTMANRITMKQDVIVTSMEWLAHQNAGLSNTGTAKIWDGNVLLAKGNTVTVNEKGTWIRSTFNSPISLKKDELYYVGFSATGIGYASAATRDIYSNDNSLLMTTASQGYRRSESGETDERPSTPISEEFSIRLYVEVNNTRFLIDSDGRIQKLSGSWADVGAAPVTDQMFKDHGMVSLSTITAEQWRALPKNSKILVYSEEDKVFKASISRNNLYNSEEKLYRGTGIIETEMEELPAYRKTLMITADHQDCTFQYSLDNGSTWNAFQSGDVIDVSRQSGKQFKIRINLPTDSAILTAISYAWA
ncbi:hypothetical protein [Bacillus thuringiensis]|uniref:hypothetical protein n=1 Tax=Bacillus thuringiensis TaxID=1428 RepID=UPI003DA0A48D